MAASFCSAAAKGGLEPLDFAEPDVFAGFVDAFDEVAADVLQAALLGRAVQRPPHRSVASRRHRAADLLLITAKPHERVRLSDVS